MQYPLTVKLRKPRTHSCKIPLFLLFTIMLCFRQGEDEPLKVSSIDDLERIRISRHKLERYLAVDQ